MNRYVVKTKYTYERVRQRDHSYSDVKKPSQNRICGRYIYETGRALFRGEVCGHAEADIASSLALELADASGFFVKTEGCVQGLLAVTFFGDTGESFMSCCGMADAEQGVWFSTYDMDFCPSRVLIQCDGDEAVFVSIDMCYVLNTLGEWGGQAHFYTCEGGEIRNDREAMRLSLGGRAYIESAVLPNGSDSVYNMLMPRRNTVLAVLGNGCGADRVRLYFTTHESPAWSESKCVELPLEAGEAPHAYYFNLSACGDECVGRLRAIRLECDGQGELVIYRYSFEQERAVDDVPLCVCSCIADAESDTVTVSGRLTEDAVLRGVGQSTGARVQVYTTCMADESRSVEGKTLVGEGEICEGGCFKVEGIPFHNGNVTLLSSQLVVFLLTDDGEHICISDRLYIENYEVLEGSPYEFEVPSYTVHASDFGALGDAYHNDTEAIQAALDDVDRMGGGRVIIDGSESFYGKRYIVTNLLIHSNTELCIQRGAVLWQSQIRRDYPYEVTYGHDGVVPGIYWTHNMHVSNLPMLQAAGERYIRICGGGKLRCMDTGSEEGVDMHQRFSCGCVDRIHLIMIGFFDVSYVECRDIELVRCNNYHTGFYHCSHVYAANMKLHEVKCLSGDGFGLMIGTHDVVVHRCYFQSNDDCLVLVAVKRDPRGLLWWTNIEDEHYAPYNITMRSSYIDANTGGGVAFITWGTDAPRLEDAQIYNIRIYDNCFGGYKAIGGWFDNPYRGRVPFDNLEQDDYSPVCNVRIHDNIYSGTLTMGCVHPTDFITDCGLHSYGDFVNGDFALGGLANWTARRNSSEDSVKTVIYCNKEKGCIDHFELGQTALCEGLYLESGRYVFSCELMTGRSGAELFVERAEDGLVLASRKFVCGYPEGVELNFCLESTGDYYIGVRSCGSESADEGTCTESASCRKGKACAESGNCREDGFAIIDMCKITEDKDL